MPYLPAEVYDEQDNEALKKGIHDAQEISRRAFEPMRKLYWPRWYQLWNNRADWSQMGKIIKGAPAQVWEGMFGSQLCIPSVFEQIETLIPRIVAGVLQNDPLVPVVPVIPPKDAGARPKYERNAAQAEAILSNQFIRNVRIREALTDWVTDCELFTLCWLFVDWVKDVGDKWVLSDKDGTLNLVKEPGRVKEDHIRVRRMSPWAVDPDPFGTSVDGQYDSRPCRYVQVTDVVPGDELLTRVKNSPLLNWTFADTKQLTDGLDSVRGKLDPEDMYDRQLMANVGRIDSTHGESWTPANAADRNLVRVIKHWEHDRVIEVWGTRGASVVACKQMGDDFPYKLGGIPMIRLRTRPVPGEIMGRGTAESCAGLNHLTNILTQLMLTGMSRSMTNVMLVNKEADIDINKFTAQPFGVVPFSGVKGPDAIHMLQYPYVTADAWRMIDYFKYLLQLTGGAADLVSGVGSSQTPDTARGVGYLVEQNSARFNLKVHCMHEGVGHLGQKMLAVNAEYMRTDMVVDILGQRGNRDFIAVDPGIFADEYACVPDMRPVAANPSAHAQALLNAYQIAATTNPNFDLDEGGMELFRALGIPYPGKLFKGKPDLAQLENDYFLDTGQFPAALPQQPHKAHMQKHAEIFPQVQKMSKTAQANYEFHLMGEHAAMAGLLGTGGGPMVTPPPGAVPQEGPGGPGPMGEPGMAPGAPPMQAPPRPGMAQGGINIQSPGMPEIEGGPPID